MRSLFISLLFSLYACSAAGSDSEIQPITFYTENDALVQPLAAAVSRVSAATGRADVRISYNGTEVSGVDEVDDGSCATTFALYYDHELFGFGIEYDMSPPKGCMEIEAVLIHEIFHALAPSAAHVEAGVFAKKGGAPRIDAESLSRLCESFECQEFAPEL